MTIDKTGKGNGMIAGEVACSETDILTSNGRITQLTLWRYMKDLDLKL